MEIGTIFPVTSLSATTFSTISENRRQQKTAHSRMTIPSACPRKLLNVPGKAVSPPFAAPTVRASWAKRRAMPLARTKPAEDHYRKQCNEYRGMGLFTAPEQTGETSSGQANAAAGSGERSSDDSSNQTAKLERQIRDLTRELEEVMAADLPDVQNEASAQELQKKISERQSQLTALKRGERMADAAVQGVVFCCW